MLVRTCVQYVESSSVHNDNIWWGSYWQCWQRSMKIALQGLSACHSNHYWWPDLEKNHDAFCLTTNYAVPFFENICSSAPNDKIYSSWISNTLPSNFDHTFSCGTMSMPTLSAANIHDESSDIFGRYYSGRDINKRKRIWVVSLLAQFLQTNWEYCQYYCKVVSLGLKRNHYRKR